MINESTLPTSVIAGFTQFIADNVDHDVSSLDGRGTFDGMGIIVCSIEKNSIPDQRRKRLAKVMASSDVAKRIGVKLHLYTQPEFKALSKIKFTPMKDLINQLLSPSSQLAVDILWHSAIIFWKTERLGQRPNWNGFMENITAGCRHPERSTITMLPLTELNSGNESCIYSTLLHIKHLAESMGIPAPSITNINIIIFCFLWAWARKFHSQKYQKNFKSVFLSFPFFFFFNFLHSGSYFLKYKKFPEI